MAQKTVVGAATGLGLVVLLVWAFAFITLPARPSGEEADFLKQFRAAKAMESDALLPDVAFIDAQGRERSFAEFRGSYVVLNVWAAWCPPCLTELPSLQKLKERFADGNLKVLAVSADTAYTLASAKALGERYGFSDVAYYHDAAGRFQDAFSLYALPVTFLVDPQGKPIYRLEGEADWSSGASVAFLRSLTQGGGQVYDNKRRIQ